MATTSYYRDYLASRVPRALDSPYSPNCPYRVVDCYLACRVLGFTLCG